MKKVLNIEATLMTICDTVRFPKSKGKRLYLVCQIFKFNGYG